MTLRTKKIAFFAALESVYGTAVALAATDAIRTKGAKLTPFEATEVQRDLDGTGFGNAGTIHVGEHVTVEIDVEMAGSGVAGTPPAYGRLFKACGMSETIVAGTSVTYAPASDSTDSLTTYLELDGQRHPARGVRGTWSIKADSQGIPYFNFKWTGCWVDPVTAASLIPDFTGFTTPRPIAYAYTPKIRLHGLDSVYKSFGFDYGGDVQFFDNPGEQSVEIMGRSCKGNVSLKAPTLTEKNYFMAARLDADDLMSFVHGKTAGGIITLNAPHAQILKPNYGDDKGRATIECGLDIKYTSKDDEMTLVFT
ncbi:MAG: hypothetical protein IJI03_17150 [Rudaea sp.]|nr:hypothetical protein [Rudaea sp.]